MKGFLHRVVSQVTRTELRLHPIVSSIYAAPSFHGVPVSPELNEERIALPPHDRASLAASRLGGVLPSETSSPFSNPGEASIEKPQVAASPQTSWMEMGTEPLVSSHSIESEDSFHSSRATDSERRGNFAGRRATNLQAGIERAAFDSSEASVSNREPFGAEPSAVVGFAPIVAEGKWPASKSMLDAELANFARSHDREGSSRLHSLREPIAPAARPVQPQSDDIQIHIGRIEVTAVTPPVPRAPAASPRKAMSLDDYLRRRNGRAG